MIRSGQSAQGLRPQRGPPRLLARCDRGRDHGHHRLSGTGKSVAIKHIVGLLEPDAGTVFVDDQEVPRLTRSELYALRAKIGYVFQFAALFDSLTIGDNVAMGLRKQGCSPAKTRSVSASPRRWSWSTCPASRRDSRPSSRAACASASASPAPSRCAPSTSCTMSPPPASIPSPAPSSTGSSCACATRSASPASSSRTTCERLHAWGRASPCCTRARVRQVGSVDEIQQTSDPVVRQFIEGRADLEEHAA
jgi:phospholipid/cholesterol/gamma-HCH transport system ATP-binding protein